MVIGSLSDGHATNIVIDVDKVNILCYVDNVNFYSLGNARATIGELVTVGVLEDLSRQDSVYLRGRK